MMTDLFPDLGKPTMKSIEISYQIVGGIGSGCIVGTGADPGFNASTVHQQNPNYQPFRQHL
jgi:hypothetical protein